MTTIRRRDFLKQAAACTTALVFARGSSVRAAAPTCKVEVLLGEPIARISPDIYGHFAEHIGGVIYDGIWVGEGSPIPNYGGIRKALVDHMPG